MLLLLEVLLPMSVALAGQAQVVLAAVLVTVSYEGSCAGPSLCCPCYRKCTRQGWPRDQAGNPH